MAGIYIHIPFCKKKCIYCDFYSIAAKADVVDNYIDALCKEIAMRKAELCGETVKTVYVGGGTPSLLGHGRLLRIADALHREFDMCGVEEFTIEVNPDDVSDEEVAAFRSMGINRVSMGVQSFIDKELKFLNRRHTADGAIEAYNTILRNGIDNVSIDLIYGIPGQTLQSWRQSVDTAMQLRPRHISCYNLSYEDGTRLCRMLENGSIAVIDDDVCVKMYEIVSDRLADCGYEHYEISNYALPGFRSRHNSNYWNKTPYIGFGASAHSYLSGRRSYNPGNIKLYVAAINDGVTVSEIEEESIAEQYDEEVMLRLRTKDGIDAGRLRSTYGEEYYAYFLNAVRGFVDSGLVERHGDVYRLSRKGVMLSDMVIRELMYDYE